MPEDQSQVRQFCEIPYDEANAVDNMAVDATLLAFGCSTSQATWRIYGWTEPAITFGYSQSWKWIQTAVPGFEGARVRRMTGGGIVDHRNDLTYCLTLPPGHSFHRMPASQLYKQLHHQIATILLDLGYQVGLMPCPAEPGHQVAGLCFEGAEPYDVVLRPSGMKVAGAAMKRNREGILIQGSLALRTLPGLSRNEFNAEMTGSLSHWLNLERVVLTGTLPVDKLLDERARFSSEAWNRKR